MSEIKINKFIEQIPKPHPLLGDLKIHGTVWGARKPLKKCKDSQEVINNNNLAIVNNKSIPTSTQSDPYLAIDLTLCDPVSYMRYG